MKKYAHVSKTGWFHLTTMLVSCSIVHISMLNLVCVLGWREIYTTIDMLILVGACLILATTQYNHKYAHCTSYNSRSRFHFGLSSPYRRLLTVSCARFVHKCALTKNFITSCKSFQLPFHHNNNFLR